MSRYATAVPLAAGGTAEVFKSFDSELGRWVALKLLHHDDPLHVERLLLEARAQARVDHPNVCKIYEVGERDGRPFIAMQYIDGETLGEAAQNLTLEERVRLVAQVADAVHAAHRVGLIHRDLKPGNVMVERDDEGELRPYVLDFGLALDESSPGGLTVTGQVLGTAAYMSPEQARGAGRQIDRRTDVWGLGATLYELLMGSSPFGGGSISETLIAILQQEVRPPRSLDPHFPRDLQTIVLKCLEKPPERRYVSARALASDLRRFLDGDVIEARPPTWAYRMQTLGRKNPLLLGVSAAALVVVLLTAGWGLASRRQADRKAALAQRFGQQVEGLEWYLRVNQMRPLHDIRPDLAEVRRQMEALQAEAGAAGRDARGPASYALGRAHLALGELEPAVAALEDAWSVGFRSPDVAWARGLALGEAYRRAVNRLRSIPDSRVRAERKEEEIRRYRTPALESLRFGASSSTAPASYVLALTAFHEDRFDAGVEALARSRVEAPWFYDAWLVEGRARIDEGIKRYARGEAKSGLAEIELADAVFTEAARVARSDPSAYLGICEAGMAALHVGLHVPLDDLAPRYERAKRACDQALQIDPERAETFRLLAELAKAWGGHRSRLGEDPEPILRRAIDLAERAVALSGGQLDSRLTLADSLLNLGWFFKNQGRDPRDLMRRTAEAYAAAAELDLDSGAHNFGLGLVLLARWEIAHGFDPEGSLTAAREQFSRWSEAFPDRQSGSWNLAKLLQTEAVWEAQHGRDPRQLLADAQRLIETSEESAEMAGPFIVLLQIHTQKAAYELATIGDPSAALEAARRAGSRSLELFPSSASAHAASATLRATIAEHLLRQGLDPTPALTKGFHHCRQTLELGSATLGHERAAALHEIEARYAAAVGADPRTAIAAGLISVEKALASDRSLSPARLTRARLLLLSAAAGQQGNRGSSVDRARQDLQAILDVDPTHSEALRLWTNLESSSVSGVQINAG